MIVSPETVQAISRRSALFAVLVVVICLGAAYAFNPNPLFLVIIPLPCALCLGWWLYQKWTGRYKRRLALMATPFPDAWRRILKERVAYYESLQPTERERFEKELQIFIAETPIEGKDCEVDDRIRVLVGASAIIPVFGFPNWEYDMLHEVIITTGTFDATLREDDGEILNASGMVGEKGLFGGVMILSKNDLLFGFSIENDKHNVGIHEFAHLIDKATGNIDGVPVSLPGDCFQPWQAMVRHELAQKMRGSDIDGYGFTGEEEFFAVISEYFFEAPDKLARKHPELYALLARIFRQDRRKPLKEIVKGPFKGKRRKSR